jgi:hypothetical protein
MLALEVGNALLGLRLPHWVVAHIKGLVAQSMSLRVRELHTT